MSPGRAKFLKQLLSFLPQNFINSEIEIGHKKLKKISWVEKSQRRHFSLERSVLDFSAMIPSRRGYFSA